MVDRLCMMPVRSMGVMRRLFVCTGLVMPGRFLMVPGGMLEVLGGLLVMFRSLLGHDSLALDGRQFCP